jgi:hypothetical protein
LLSLVLIATVTATWAWRRSHPSNPNGPAGAPFMTQSAHGLTVTLFEDGGLKLAANTVTVEFRDATSGALTDAGRVRFELGLEMAGLVMHVSSAVAPIPGAPGRYRTTVKPDLAGYWVGTITYDGPHGKGAFTFPAKVSP